LKLPISKLKAKKNYILFFIFISCVWFVLSLDIKTKKTIHIDIKSNVNYSFKVFWIPFFKSNFTEKYSKTIQINKSEIFISYKLSLPWYPIRNTLRIDPIDNSGEIIFNNLIVTNNNQKYEFKIDRDNFKTDGLEFISVEDGIRVISNSNDPQIILNLNSISSFQKSYMTNIRSIFYIFNDFSNIELKGIFFLLIFCVLFAAQYTDINNTNTKKFFISSAVHIFLFIVFYRSVIYFHPLFDVTNASLTAIGHMNYYGLSKFSDKFSLYVIALYFLIFFFIVNIIRSYGNKK
jgi:hypothetical protein